MKKYTAPEFELFVFNQIDVLEGSGESAWRDPDPDYNGTPYYPGPVLKP